MKIRNLAKSPRTRFALLLVLAGNISVAAVVMSTTGLHNLQEKQGRKSTEPPMAARGKMGQDLFLAIDHRDVAQVKALLSKGADPNSRNGLEFTPLYIASASYQMDVMCELLKAGAEPDAESNYGTPLMFAASSGNVVGARILLGKGVDIEATRNDGMTILMMASYSGNPEFVSELIGRKADVNVKDDSGASALTYAALAGQDKVAELLLKAGIEVDSTNVENMTPLMIAAKAGQAKVVKVLLEHKANPNAKDMTGQTSLILAAKYSDSAEIARLLKASGANTKATDSKGRTAGTIASMRGRNGIAKVVGNAKGSSMSRSPKQAVVSSLNLIQSSMNKFENSTSCASCHHEGLGRMATGMAQDRGFKLDPQVAGRQKAMLTGMTTAMKPLHEGALQNPEVMKQVPLIEINEVSSSDTWFLAGMAAHKQPGTDGTAAMARVLGKQQSKDGQWSISGSRAPMQSSPFTFTALSIKSLDTYAPKADATRIAEQKTLALRWMLSTPAKNSEDRASRLLGLKWLRHKDIKKAVAEIKADQRPDGGWAQLPNLSSDAYATGQALYALHEGGGMPVNDPIYQKGVKFLLQNQDEDGSWFVNKRAIPANNYFDGGFPHGQSQYSSFNGSCWALMALLETIK